MACRYCGAVAWMDGADRPRTRRWGQRLASHCSIHVGKALLATAKPLLLASDQPFTFCGYGIYPQSFLLCCLCFIAASARLDCLLSLLRRVGCFRCLLVAVEPGLLSSSTKYSRRARY